MRPYATELTASYPRHLLVALGIAAGVHLALVCSYYGGALLHDGAEPWGRREITPVFLLPPPVDPAPKAFVRPAAVQSLEPARGVPVPVVDPVVDPVLDVEPAVDPGLVMTGPGTDAGPVPGDVLDVPGGTLATPGVLDSEEVGFVPCERFPEAARIVTPEYPSIARAAGLEGRVEVLVLVSESGHVARARVWRSTDTIFEAAALEAAKKWSFIPALQDNRPVAVWVQIPFVFSLRDAR